MRRAPRAQERILGQYSATGRKRSSRSNRQLQVGLSVCQRKTGVEPRFPRTRRRIAGDMLSEPDCRRPPTVMRMRKKAKGQSFRQRPSLAEFYAVFAAACTYRCVRQAATLRRLPPCRLRSPGADAAAVTDATGEAARLCVSFAEGLSCRPSAFRPPSPSIFAGGRNAEATPMSAMWRRREPPAKFSSSSRWHLPRHANAFTLNTTPPTAAARNGAH